jgi:sialate O-acetylesterase
MAIQAPRHAGWRSRDAFASNQINLAERLPGSIRLRFAHADGGLVVKGEKLEDFSVAGEDRKWYWAEAQIEGDTVTVSSPSVPSPKEARYAWQSNPAATLLNFAGLPVHSVTITGLG